MPVNIILKMSKVNILRDRNHINTRNSVKWSKKLTSETKRAENKKKRKQGLRHLKAVEQT